MALGLAGGYGAGAASATLGDILKQKFLEQIQKQKLAEDIRQATMQQTTANRGLDIQQENLSENRALRQQTLDDTRYNREQAQKNAAENTDIRKSAEFRSGLALRPVGSLVTPVEKAQFNMEHLAGMTTPGGADEHGQDPHFHFAGTAADQRATATEQARADAAKAQQTFTHGENELNRQNAVRVAGMRSTAASGTGLSDAAVDQAARSYLTTGAMPALGMGAAGTRIAIMNRAGELDPNRSVALSKADYASDAASLKSLQQTTDAMTAFKAAAKANLQQFDALVSKLPDTGVPWANTPIRAFAKSGAGSADIAAAEAAKQVALREIARITTSLRGTGQLSDAARHETSNLIPDNATVNQIRRVMTVLQTDLDNVEREARGQLGTIRGRIQANTPGGGGGGGGDTSAPPKESDEQRAARIKKMLGG